MNWNNAQKYAPVVVRIGLSIVFLWFGISQLTSPLNWIGWVPAEIAGMINVYTVILFNGIFEIVFGVLLLFGVFTRVSAFLLALHLLGITVSVGFNEIGVRDFGLTLALVSVFLHGPDALCWDSRRR